MAGHISPKSTYYAVFAALMIGTAITVAVAFVNLGSFNFPVAIGIAVTKATLVILLGLSLTDYLSRGMKTYPGGAAGAGYGVRTETPADQTRGREEAGAARTEH